MIPSYYFDTTVQMLHAILPAGDGLTFTGMSRAFTTKSCVICAQGTKRFSPTNTISSPCKNFVSMSDSVMMIQEQLIRADSRVILTVGFVGPGFMVTTNFTRTVEINTNDAMSVIGGCKDGNISIMWTMARWNSILGTTTFCVWTKNALTRNLWCLSQKWI